MKNFVKNSYLRIDHTILKCHTNSSIGRLTDTAQTLAISHKTQKSAAPKDYGSWQGKKVSNSWLNIHDSLVLANPNSP